MIKPSKSEEKKTVNLHVNHIFSFTNHRITHRQIMMCNKCYCQLQLQNNVTMVLGQYYQSQPRWGGLYLVRKSFSLSLSLVCSGWVSRACGPHGLCRPLLQNHDRSLEHQHTTIPTHKDWLCKYNKNKITKLQKKRLVRTEVTIHNHFILIV